MSDETVDKTDKPEIDPNASKADLKAAADEILKAAKQDAPKEAEEAAETAEEVADPLTVLQAEFDQIRDQNLRLLAEMENLRKRSEREKADAKAYAIEKFAGDLLSVSDNMARALDALPDSERAQLTDAGKNLLGGIGMTRKELHTVLQRHGMAAIEPEPGDVFDPNLHQAVAQVPSDHPNGTVAALFQIGWKIGERTLRAAMVSVSAGQAN